MPTATPLPRYKPKCISKLLSHLISNYVRDTALLLQKLLIRNTFGLKLDLSGMSVINAIYCVFHKIP